MKRAGLLVILLVMMAGQAGARVNGGCAVTGLLIVPESSDHQEFEIRLINDVNRVVDRVLLHADARFTFSGLDNSVYYLEADTPGYKPVRQRLEFPGPERTVSASIVLEAEEQIAVVKKVSLLGDNAAIDVTRMSQSSALLKDFDDIVRKVQGGNLLDSRRRLEGIVMEAPKFYDAHKVLGAVYQQQRRYDDAEKEYRIAQDLRPQSAGPLVSLGGLYLDQADTGGRKMIARALDVLRRAVELDRDIAFAHYLLGVAYYKSSQYDEATRSLVRALDLEPRLGNARLALANVSIRTEDWVAALSQLDAYLKDNANASDRDAVIAKRRQIEHLSH